MARARLLATMAILCSAAIGCHSSPYAGMQYECSCGYGPGRWAVGAACGCGDQCAVECDSNCVVACGDSCGCSAGGGMFNGRVLNAICGCDGCGGNLYWSEWHNDPPRCQDPCNCHGDWIGPGYGPGCCPSCGPGGCVGAQGGPNNSTGYASAAPARNNGANRAMVSQNARPVQSQPVRTASRPVNRQQMNSNVQPSRPIQW
jgi:hypothetical protein